MDAGRYLRPPPRTRQLVRRGPERSRTALGSGCIRRGPELSPGAARSGIARGLSPAGLVIPGPAHIPFERAGPWLMPWTWSGQTPPRTGLQKYPALVAAPLVTTGSHQRGAIDLRGNRRRRSGPLAGRHRLGAALDRGSAFEPTICAMARVTYESKDHAGHKFWVARYGRYAIRIDATRAASTRGSSPWRAARSATGWPPSVTRLPMR